LGAFAGLVAVAGLFEADWIQGRGAPLLVGSFGAAAVLEFNGMFSCFFLVLFLASLWIGGLKGSENVEVASVLCACDCDDDAGVVTMKVEEN